MLNFSLVYSRIQYGITLWGTSAKTYMREINVRLNNVVRLMTYSKKYSHVAQLYKHLNLLKLNIYKFELANICIYYITKNFQQFYHHNLPKLKKSTLITPDKSTSAYILFHNQQNQLLKTSWLFGAQNYGVASTAQLRTIAGVSLNKNIKFI